MSLVVPHTFIAGDDATATVMQTLTDPILQMQGAVPSTGQPYDVFEAYTSVAQSIPNGTATAVAMDIEIDDLANGHSTSTNTSRYTGKNPGRYFVALTFSIASNGTGRRIGELRLNGGAIGGPGKSHNTYPDQAGGTAFTIATVQRMNGTTDYIEGYITQTSGGALGTQLRMCVQYLGA